MQIQRDYVSYFRDSFWHDLILYTLKTSASLRIFLIGLNQQNCVIVVLGLSFRVDLRFQDVVMLVARIMKDVHIGPFYRCADAS